MLEALGIVIGTIISIFLFIGLYCIFKEPIERKSEERRKYYYKNKSRQNLINVKDQNLKQNGKNYCNKSFSRTKDIG